MLWLYLIQKNSNDWSNFFFFFFQIVVAKIYEFSNPGLKFKQDNIIH